MNELDHPELRRHALHRFSIETPKYDAHQNMNERQLAGCLILDRRIWESNPGLESEVRIRSPWLASALHFSQNKTSDYAKGNPPGFPYGQLERGEIQIFDGRTVNNDTTFIWNTNHRLRFLPAASRSLDEVEQIQNFSFVINLEFLN